MAPISLPLSTSGQINIVGVVVSFLGVVLATGLSYISLRLQMVRRRPDGYGAP
ncbi:hypothetical protein IWZ03DRAFT_410227 [Phyllosticta citriasiana]|uniref:Uncharacterized protein n=1 Tax=Phyllosticta citriasiana TaxID=595635 RepID=A0ABR1L1D3_9PEZI